VLRAAGGILVFIGLGWEVFMACIITWAALSGHFIDVQVKVLRIDAVSPKSPRGAALAAIEIGRQRCDSPINDKLDSFFTQVPDVHGWDMLDLIRCRVSGSEAVLINRFLTDVSGSTQRITFVNSVIVSSSPIGAFCAWVLIATVMYSMVRFWDTSIESRTYLACLIPAGSAILWGGYCSTGSDPTAVVLFAIFGSIFGPGLFLLTVAIVMTDWRPNFFSDVVLDVLPRGHHQALVKTPLERAADS